MKIYFCIPFFISFSINSSAQEQCEPNNEPFEDIHNITKCTIEDVKDALADIDNKHSIVQKKVIKKRNKQTSLSLKEKDRSSIHKITILKENDKLINKLVLKNDAIASIKKIPFYLVEQIPLFPKCKNVSLLKQSKCFEKQMARHVFSNFNYPKKAFDRKIEGRILLQFIIDEEGNVTNIKNKGAEGTDLLKKEAVRLISKLPKFIPGKHQGKIVKVKYGLPITFKLPSSKSN
ncbi:energy transducer TonB [Tenacibaculum maritimum]|uniref:energy transducer TonB n=1 Tax=Tenacibaculum maritimum TaxID=107401 RepID=UPI0012E45374|nr:energy transducer TonB [Tenacibaculum maritimum]MCD9581611.1 energy transducer TonB [Tenacibaculum maritimum]MCD9636103.1 energy transducer TonB [Tenacibaculum maritimum]CAA0174607.1 hypothetical protein USCSE301_180013 [Tenacibaculum maritimum]CAA0177051.1 hypothetical protein USCSP91_180047 [Tenacibaculum maritimum]CAA0179258.1 hypothetical protein NACSLCCMFF_20040 [Tenacibaculum maritimum]